MASSSHVRRESAGDLDATPGEIADALGRVQTGHLDRGSALAVEARDLMRAESDERARRYDDDDDGEHEPAAPLAPVPKFPVSDLCGPLADLVSSTEFPAPLVAGWGLGILAGLAGMADVTIEDSLPLAGPLWIMCIAKRGRAKTPSFDYAARCLRGLEVEARRGWQRQVADWKSAPEDARGDFPTDPLRLFDDITLEGCARLLNRRDGTGLVPVDELAGWIGRMGKYGNAGGGSERARWLSMWSAQPWAYQRVGGAGDGGLAVDIFIERPVVSIVGGIQPALLGALGSDSDGFPPRWLPFWYDGPKTPWARRLHVPAEWDAAIAGLYDARQARGWRLDGAGLDLWQDAAALWARQAEGDEASATAGALDKADIQCASVAKVIAESMHPGRGGSIPVEAVRCAIALVNYCMDVWRAMPGNQSMSLSRKDEVLNQGVDELASWLEDRAARDLDGQSRRWATSREIIRGHVAGVRTAGDAAMLIDRYRAVFPGHVVTYRPPGGGRPGRAIIAPLRSQIGGKSAGEFVARRQTPLDLHGPSGGESAQVTGSGCDVGHTDGVATNPLATNSGDKLWRQTPPTDSDGAPVGGTGDEAAWDTLPGWAEGACTVCGGTLDAALVEAGMTDHGERQ